MTLAHTIIDPIATLLSFGIGFAVAVAVAWMWKERTRDGT